MKKVIINWEETTDKDTVRCKVPGGWIVFVQGYYKGGPCFIPDKNHKWIE